MKACRRVIVDRGPLTGERVIVEAQRQLRRLPGFTQSDAEAIAAVTASEGWGIATGPLSTYASNKVNEIIATVMSRTETTVAA